MSIRKALLVGINAYQGAPLRGCINDVKQMKELLQRFYGFSEDGFRVVLDKEATTAGIKAGLEWLAQGGDESDAVRVFHYSGHGSFIADQNGDEPDGSDECLVPYDYQSVGMLTDDTLKTLYDRFPRAGNLTLIMDSCHSGSVQRDVGRDIVYRFLPVSTDELDKVEAAAARFAEEKEKYVFEKLQQARNQNLTDEALRQQVRTLISGFEKKRFGDIRVREANVLLAGCRADQTSADAHISSDYHGAFTYYLAEGITQSNGQISYGQLGKQVGRQLSSNGFSQIPQLECRSKRDQRPAFRPFS